MTENKKAPEVEGQEEEVNGEKQLSSLELIWKLGFDELDAWAERFNKGDDLFLQAVKNYVATVKRNQENFKEISEQFSKEVREWEKAAREEFLSVTTPIQHFFPVKSYEEMNQIIDDIQSRTMSLLFTPARVLTTSQALDRYLETIEKFVAFRKKGRGKYIDSVKKTSNVLLENQKMFVNLFAKQVKTAMLPFQRYLKEVSEQTKS